MVESNKFADAQYLGPATSPDPEIVFMEGDSIALGTSTAHQYAAAPAIAKPLKASSTETTAATTTGPPKTTTTTTIHPPGAPDRLRMKKIRKKRKVVAGVVGGTIGLVVLGPLGAIGVGVGSALVVKHSDKARERRLIRSYDDRMTQHRAATAIVPVHAGYRA